MSFSYAGAMADTLWGVAGASARLSLLGRFSLEHDGQATAADEDQEGGRARSGV